MSLKESYSGYVDLCKQWKERPSSFEVFAEDMYRFSRHRVAELEKKLYGVRSVPLTAMSYTQA